MTAATSEWQASAVEPRVDAGPRGPKPRRVSIARIGIYAFLVMSAIYFTIPLWVMVVTSLKTMPEIR